MLRRRRQLVTRRQLNAREAEWFSKSKAGYEHQLAQQRARAQMEAGPQGYPSGILGNQGWANQSAQDPDLLSPVKYMLSQTARTLSLAEDKLHSAQRRADLEYSGPGASAGSYNAQPETSPAAAYTALPLIGSPRGGHMPNFQVRAQERKAPANGGDDRPPLASSYSEPVLKGRPRMPPSCESRSGRIEPGDLESHGSVIMAQDRRVSLARSSEASAKSHQANVSRVTELIEATHLELCEAEDAIFYLEHIQLAKAIWAWACSRAKRKLVEGWRAWAGSAKPGPSRGDVLVDLRLAAAESRLRLGAADASLEARLASLAMTATRSLDSRKRTFLVSVLGKNGPEGRRCAFLRWRLWAQGLARQERTWTKFFKKVENLKVHMAMIKWRLVLRERDLPPEQLIEGLKLQLAQQRTETGKWEAKLEAVLADELASLMESLDNSTKAKLRRTMTNMFNRAQKLYFGHWATKMRKAKRFVEVQIGVFNRMLKSFLNKGWNKWEIWFRELQQAEAANAAAKMLKMIALGNQQVAQLNALLKQQIADVEQMRESIVLQAAAAARVADCRKSVLDECGNGMALCAVDIDSLFAADEAANEAAAAAAR